MLRTFLLILLLGAMACAQPAPQLVLQVGHTEDCTSLSWGPGGLLLSGSSDGTAKVWDRHLLATLAPTDDLAGLQFASWLSPREIVTARNYSDFKVYDWKTGQVVRSFTSPHGGHLTANGRWIAVSSGPAVHVYDASTGKEVHRFQPPADKGSFAPGLVAISPDGQRLATVSFCGDHGSARSRLDCVNLANGQVRSVPTKGFDTLVFNPPGDQLAGSAGSTLTIVSVPSLKPERTLPLPSYLSDLSWPRSDRLVAGAHQDGKPAWYAWNPATGQLVATGKVDYADTVALSPDGQTVARAWNNAITLEDLESRPQAVLGGQVPVVNGLLATADRLIVALSSGQLATWDLHSGARQGAWQAQRGFFGDTALTADGRRLAVCDEFSGTVTVLDPATGDVVKAFPSFFRGGRGSIRAAFNADASLLAVSAMGQLTVLDTRTWLPVATADAHGDSYALLWSGDTLTVLDVTVKQYEAKTLKLLAERRATDTEGYPLVFTCGRYLASGDLWMGTDRGPLCVLPKGGDDLVRLRSTGPSYLRGLAVSPDGRTVVSTGDHSHIVVWDVASRTPRDVHPVRHGEDYRRPVFLAGGRTLAAVSSDQRIHFWDTDRFQDLGELVVLDGGKNWIVAAAGGQFDGTPEGQRTLEWRVGDELYRLDQFFEKFFRPGLLKDLVAAGAPTGPTVSVQPRPPVLEVVSPAAGTELKSDEVEVAVKVTERGSGAANLRLYVNGHPQAAGTRDGDRVLYKARLIPGVNELRAAGFDASGQVESRGDWVRVHCQSAAARQPQLFVLACGIDKYPQQPLKYARADAEAFVGSLTGQGLFSSVKPTLLLDEKATRAALLDTLAALAREAQPQDTLVVYLSGHGSTVAEVYQYACADGQALTAQELATALEAVPAARQLLVLDTCHSGAASGDLASRFIRGQQRMARGSGTFLLAASRSQESALEVPGVQHGLLTFAVLRGLGQGGASLNPHQQLTANGLVQYASYDVEELARKYGAQQEVVQYSTGRDFPLLQR